MSKKLLPWFEDPCRILKICNNHTVEILPTKGGKVQLVYVNRRKPLLDAMIWKDDPCPEFKDVRTNEEELSTNVNLTENTTKLWISQLFQKIRFQTIHNSLNHFMGLQYPPRRKRKDLVHDPIKRPERPAGLRLWSKIKQRECLTKLCRLRFFMLFFVCFVGLTLFYCSPLP